MEFREAYKGSEPYIFISYAHKDTKRVLPYIDYLMDKGYRVWYDEGISPGSEWPEEIEKALKNSSCFLTFTSENSVASINVRNEINFALNNEVPFLAAYLENTELKHGLALRMGDIQAVMLHKLDPEQIDKKFDIVLDQKLRVVGESNIELPPTSKKQGSKFLPVVVLVALLAIIFLSMKGGESPKVELKKDFTLKNLQVKAEAPQLNYLNTLAPGSIEAKNLQEELVEKGWPLQIQLKNSGIWMRLIPPGKGSKPIYMGKYEVSQAEWEKVMGDNPSKFKDTYPHGPVNSITYFDMQEFVQKATVLEKLPKGVLMIPGVTMWVHCARAGTSTKTYFGDKFSTKNVNAGGIHGQTLTRNHKLYNNPNAWGLYNMYGNVSELTRTPFKKGYFTSKGGSYKTIMKNIHF